MRDLLTILDERDALRAEVDRVTALAEKWESATELGTGNPSIVTRAFAEELRKALAVSDAG